MTIKDVKSFLQEIERKIDYGDDEAAHSKRDDLYLEVLRAIADNKVQNPQALAELAITIEDNEFASWCA
jgi:hypothetical protein